MKPDPFVLPAAGDSNLVRYVRNFPAVLIDPTGLDDEFPIDLEASNGDASAEGALPDGGLPGEPLPAPPPRAMTAKDAEDKLDRATAWETGMAKVVLNTAERDEAVRERQQAYIAMDFLSAQADPDIGGNFRAGDAAINAGDDYHKIGVREAMKADQTLTDALQAFNLGDFTSAYDKAIEATGYYVVADSNFSEAVRQYLGADRAFELAKTNSLRKR